MDLAVLRDFIVKKDIAFLVLDPVAYMIGGADGNAYSEVGAILIALRQVAEETGLHDPWCSPPAKVIGF